MENKVAIFLPALFVSMALLAQDKQYVCTPCGSDCDNEIYAKPGTCKHCNMALVEKSTTTAFQNITPEELCARVEANPQAVLLDVRSPGEFTGTGGRASFGHFKNAININITELEGRLGELEIYKDQEVIVYCSHSHRSPRASYLLTSNGFKNVKNMSGGVSTIGKSADGPCLSKIYVKH